MTQPTYPHFRVSCVRIVRLRATRHYVVGYYRWYWLANLVSWFWFTFMENGNVFIHRYTPEKAYENDIP